MVRLKAWRGASPPGRPGGTTAAGGRGRGGGGGEQALDRGEQAEPPEELHVRAAAVDGAAGQLLSRELQLQGDRELSVVHAEAECPAASVLPSREPPNRTPKV